MKVLYIMGAGHIGSTIVDIVLGSHAHVESLGELSKFHRAGWTPDSSRVCACGSPVHECAFWVEIRRRWSEMTGCADGREYIRAQTDFENSTLAWPRLLLHSSRGTPQFKRYLELTGALYRAIHEVGGKPVLVESSLTPRRAYGLAKNPDLDLYLIHMVRDGRGVIWSLMKPGKQALITKKYIPAPPFRTSRYWVSANLQSAWVYGQVPAAKRMMMRYEDFVLDPASVVTRIGSFVGEDLSGVMNGSVLANSSPVRHTVGGNRIRMQKDIHIRADFAWMEHLAEKDQLVFWRTAGWLARRFGYRQPQTDYSVGPGISPAGAGPDN